MEYSLVVGFSDRQIPPKQYWCKCRKEMVQIIRYWMRNVNSKVEWEIEQIKYKGKGVRHESN